MAEFAFKFDVVHSYEKTINSDNLADAMQEFRKWYKEKSDLNLMDAEDEELKDLQAVWELKDDGEHEPRWEDVWEWGTVIPNGGCAIEDFQWIERK